MKRPTSASAVGKSPTPSARVHHASEAATGESDPVTRVF